MGVTNGTESKRITGVGTTYGLTGTEWPMWVEEERKKLREKGARAREHKEQD